MPMVTTINSVKKLTNTLFIGVNSYFKLVILYFSIKISNLRRAESTQVYYGTYKNIE
jgi:hypothetical protein